MSGCYKNLTAGYSGKLNHVNLQRKKRNLSGVDLQAGDGRIQRRGTHPALQGLYISILKDIMGRGVSTLNLHKDEKFKTPARNE